MIKRFSTFIKSVIKEFSNKIKSQKLKNNFSDFDWNYITTMLLLEFYANGDKQYTTINRFIELYSPSTEYSSTIHELFGEDIKSLLLSSKKLTEDQKNLLNNCKRYRINSSIIPILETINDYEYVSRNDYNYDNIDYNYSSIL